MVSKGDYNEALVRAAHAVLLEVARVLGEYRDGVVVVGGWVPELVIPEHVGPVGVVDFEEVADPDERDRIARDASERALALIEKLGIF